jgi:hypothetical protein
MALSFDGTFRKTTGRKVAKNNKGKIKIKKSNKLIKKK